MSTKTTKTSVILVHNYKTGAEHFDLGPITYHWFGVGSDSSKNYEFRINEFGSFNVPLDLD